MDLCQIFALNCIKINDHIQKNAIIINFWPVFNLFNDMELVNFILSGLNS